MKVGSLQAGEVGYMAANIKAVDHARVGDTITLTKAVTGINMVHTHTHTPSNRSENAIPASSGVTPLPGYAPPKPMVYAGLYPSDPDDYDNLRDAMLKLKLNDAALSFQPETSTALGFGFRSGFLGEL
ncbi:hypothetical protein EON63_16080 [archaeon]|nr:MAG: hypothetical protein EON63_16080 [archaeon]